MCVMTEKKGSGFTGIFIALIAKGAKLLKFAKLFKVAKPLVLFISMSISAIAYTFLFGPWLAILFVLLLLIHEMGHVVAMRLKGFDTPTPVFIPFLGAAIFAPKFGNRDEEAFVGYGGPLLGTLGSLACFGIWALLPKHTPLANILLVGSYLGTYLNLFNLLPISPLDGGRVTQAAGRWFKYIGLIGLAVFSMYYRQPVILYIWILVLVDLTMIPMRLRAVMVTSCWIAMVILMSLGFGDQPWWVNIIDAVLTLFFVILSIGRAFKVAEDTEEDTRPDLSPRQRVFWGGSYAALALLLGVVLMMQVHYLPTVGHH